MEATQKSTYLYKLYLGNSIEKFSTPIDAIELEQLGKVVVKHKNVDYTLAMQGVKVDRKVYQPGKIEVEISAEGTTEPTPEVLEQLLQKRIAKLVVSNDTQKSTFIVAENYYVQEVIPQFVRQASGSNQIYVKLIIYSVDKLMTLSKYSRVHVAKKLGDIMTVEAKTFGFKEAVISTDKSAMQHLKYKHSKTEKDTEFIHPYLVQYNETFYEFLARTANRCGEFLFFENGKLNLGLPGADVNAKLIENYYSLTFQNVSESPKNVTDFRRDSVKSSTTVGDLNFETDKNKGSYPSDIFKYEKDQQYNMEIGEDEYIYPLYKGKTDSKIRQMGYDTVANGLASTLLPAVAKTLNSDGNVAKLIQGITADEAKLALLSWKSSDANNKKVDDTLDDSYKEKLEQAAGTMSDDKTKLKKVESYVAFGSVDEKGWPTAKFYSDVHKAQVEKQRKMVCIDMGTAYADLKLGQKIKLKKENADGTAVTTYIITQIKQTADQKWQRDYHTYGDDDNDIYNGSQSMLVYAIPEYKTDTKVTYYPPLREEPMFRQGEPQTAFVVDNNDPKYQGRVRIVYPWQTPNYDGQKEIIDADQELYKAQQKKEVADQNYAKWLKMFTDIDTVVKSLDKIDEGVLADELNKDRLARLKALWGDDKNGGLIQSTTVKIEENKKKIAELSEKIKQKKGESIEKDPQRDTIIAASELEKKGLEQENDKLDKELDKLKLEYNQLNEEVKAIKDYELLVKSDEKKAKDRKKELANKIQDMKAEVDKAAEKLTNAENAVTAKKNIFDNALEKLDDEVKKMASPWIRVATPMATAGGGTYFKPRTGDEVLVNYDNGNVEHPYVVGSLFSKNLLDPNEALSREMSPGMNRNASMTIMSPNGHTLAFNDPGDSSKFIAGLYPGLKTLATFALPFFPKLKIGEEGKDLCGGIRLGDRFGMYSIEMSSHDRKISISSPMGNVAIDAFQGITVSAPNGDVTIKGKNVKIEAGNNLSLLSGTNIKPASDRSPTGHAVTDFVVDTLQANVDSLVSSYLAPFGDLSLIRNIIEVFVRPIEGTACIKSKRYLKLEAGPGACAIEKDRMKDKRTEAEKEKANVAKEFFNKLQDPLNEFNEQLLLHSGIYKNLWKAAYEAKTIYNENATSMLTNPENVDIVQKAWGKQKWADFTLDEFTNHFVADDTLASPEDAKRIFLANANAYGKAVFAVKKQLKMIKDNLSTDFQTRNDPFWDKMSETYDNKSQTFYDKWTAKYGNNTPSNAFLATDTPDDVYSNDKDLKVMKRIIAATYLIQVSESDIANHDILKVGWKASDVTEKMAGNNYDWGQFVGKMDNAVQSKALWWIFDTFAKPIIDKFNLPAWKKTFNRDVWAEGKDGQILFSDTKDHTTRMEKNQLVNYDHPKKGNLDLLKKYLTSLK